MKITVKSCIVYAITAVLLAGLTSCSNADKIVGIWNGSGDFSINGDLSVEQIIFEDDGTGIAIGVGENVEFTYSLSNEIITVSFSEKSHRAVPYEIDGNTLTLNDRAVFTKDN